MTLNRPLNTFTGKCGANVEAFHFTYDNVLMRGKNEEDKAACLLAYLDGEARASYRANFIAGWSLSEKSRDYGAVCRWLVQQFAKQPTLTGWVELQWRFVWIKTTLSNDYLAWTGWMTKLVPIIEPSTVCWEKSNGTFPLVWVAIVQKGLFCTRLWRQLLPSIGEIVSRLF